LTSNCRTAAAGKGPGPMPGLSRNFSGPISSPWAAKSDRTATGTASPTCWWRAWPWGCPRSQPLSPALPEIIRNETSGLLSAPGDAGAMAENMRRLLTDEALRHRVISGGRELVQSSFDNRRLIGELADMYRRVLAGHDRSAQSCASPSMHLSNR
jgi:hypothetical protein